MGQPHLSGIRLPPKPCRLLECHVLILPGLGGFFLLTVHAFADKKIIILRVFGNDRNRTGIRRISHRQAAAHGA